MKHRLLSAALAAFLLVGCGGKFGRIQNPNFTTVSFSSHKRGAVNASASILTGGIMIYAVSTVDGRRYAFKLNDEFDTTSFIIPNGNYKFLGVGYASSGLSGSMYCGFGAGAASATAPTTSETISLSGLAQTVYVTLSAPPACGALPFNDAAFRSGSTPLPVSLVFCSQTTSIDTFNTSNDCTNGQESTHFILSQNTAMGVKHNDVNLATGRAVYLADMMASGRFELFSANLNGTDTVRQNHALLSGEYVNRLGESKGVNSSNKMVYTIHQTSPQAMDQLYVTTIGRQGDMLISKPVCGPSCVGVKDFRVTGDGRYVVYVGEMDSAGKSELYSIDLTSANPAANNVKLSLVPTGGGVSNFSGGSTQPMYEISPDQTKIVYVGQFDSSTQQDVYTATINSAGSQTRIYSTSSAVGTVNTDGARFTADGLYLAWRSTYNAAGVYEFFSCPVSGCSTPNTLNAAVVNGSNGPFALSDTGHLAAFSADAPGTPNVFELYTVDVSNPATRTKVHPYFNAGFTNRMFSDMRFTPDNTKIVYITDTDETTPGTNDLFSAVIGSAGSKVKLNSAIAAAPGFQTANGPGGGGHERGPFRILNNTTLIYSAEQNAPAKYELFKATIGSSGTDALISNFTSLPGTASVESYDVDYANRIFYSIKDSPVAGKADGYFLSYTAPSTFSAQAGLNTYGSGALIDYLRHIGSADMLIPGYENVVFFEGSPAGTTTNEYYYRGLYNDTTTGSTLKISHMANGPQTGGRGRYRMSLLAYAASSPSAIDVVAGEISSPCLTGPTTINGSLTPAAPAVYVPSGTTLEASPFALALDVFPETDDGTCSGPSIRYLLPQGLANYGASPQGALLRAVGDGSTNLRLFVKDP